LQNYTQSGGENGAATALAGGWVIAIAEPTPIGEGIMLAATGATTLVYGPRIVEKMTREIDRIAAKAAGPQGITYQLTVNVPGTYIDVRGYTVTLNTGDVWKYGETTGRRYSQNELNNMIPGGVTMSPLHSGSQAEIKIAEKYFIYGHAIMHGSFPPGNRIFR